MEDSVAVAVAEKQLLTSNITEIVTLYRTVMVSFKEAI
jgi:hypothetical protein